MMYFKKSIVLVACALMGVSCSKNVFDEQDYKTIVETAQPVTGIDDSHTWELTTTYYITARVGNYLSEAKQLQILTANPAAGEGATVLANYLLGSNSVEYIAFTAPSYLQKFYAALIDEDGRYTVTALNPGSRTIDFSQPLATKATVQSYLVGQQSFAYCFEDEMPEPGDYDYNDVVLRMSMERTATNQITLDVTLVAVGSLNQIAAAIRLLNYDYADIESVTTLDNENFNQGYRKTALPYIDSNDLLIKGRDNEAVINLFEDAHWATGAATYTSEGYIPRYKYNVSKTTSEEHDMMSPRTVSYVITFKNATLLDYFTFDKLDPFIIIEYNGVLMESHAKYSQRSATVLHDYKQPTNATILPWALEVPDGSFRYPLDGVNIGYAKDGALFGAFMTTGHAFGEWAANKDRAHDWYNYPTGNMVY